MKTYYLKYGLLILVIFILKFNLIGQSYIISGTISDNNNGESLIGCNVYLIDKSVGIATNNYGYYSLEIPSGKQKLVFSYIGYKSDTVLLNLQYDTIINLSLIDNNKQIEAFDIISKKSESKQLGKNQISIVELKSMPAVFGESDVMKSIQLLPGVQSAVEGTTNLSIRGGSHDQNLIILDEAPVYNPSHVLNLVSAFNSDALKEINFYKGFIPAQYGGRLSSVIDLRMKEGNNKKMSASGGIGFIASKLTFEMPIIKDKASIIMSGRFGYPGYTLNGITAINTGPLFSNIPSDNVVWFYDFNVKANYQINNNNKIYLSAYTSKDEFELQPLDAHSNIKWGNTTFTGRWNHIINNKVFMNQSIIHSSYNYYYNRLNDFNNYYWSSGLTETDYKIDFDNFVNTKNHLKYGGKIGFQRFLPGEIKKVDNYSNYKEFSLHNQKALTADLYISNNFKLSKKIDVTIGLRYSSLLNVGDDEIPIYDDNGIIIDTAFYSKGEPIKYHWGLEPRLLFKYKINQYQSLQASYIRTKQYVHLLSNSAIGMPTDVWIPANTYIDPANSNQYSIGYLVFLNKLNIDLTTEVYYRDINNIIDFVDNADLFVNNEIEKQLLAGKRKSYGIEFLAKKDFGKFKGWFSYTLSKTEQKVEGINNDNWYPTFYDKRHNLSIFLSYKLSKTLEIGSVFKFTTGGHMTVPTAVYYLGPMEIPYVEYSDRNAYQLPNYHRLDFTLIYSSKKNLKRKWKSEWVFGVYNAYNRKNVFSIDAQVNMIYNIEIYKVYLYGIVPYLTYNFKI